MEKKLIILFGAPGSGKGYLGECIKNKLHELGEHDFSYISTGDLLRAEIKAQTPLGKQIEEIVSSGKLVSDEIVAALVYNALEKDNKIKILDGYPRTTVQFWNVCETVEKLPHDIVSIKRDTSIELIKERVSKRRVCKDCKTTHSVDDGCCPKCGGVSEIRKDDAVIDRRLAEYHRETEALWDDIMAVSVASLTVDGSRDAHEVAEEFVKILL